MKKITKNAMVTAIIATILVLSDHIITKILNQDASFTWIAFINWTVFMTVTNKERLKAIPGYIIGFVTVVIIINFGSLLSGINTVYIPLGALLATFVINFLLMYLEKIKKYFPISFAGIFVGMSVTFSGLGIGASVNTLENSILILSVMIIYGILGLISGWISSKV